MTSNPKQCDFLLMRYVPDPFKNEFINIGVMLLARDEEFADARFTRDWGRVRCLDPEADIDILEALEKDLREQLSSSPEARRQILYRLQDTLSNALQVSEPRAMLSAAPEKDLAELARTYLERPRPKRERQPGARQRIVSQMQTAFEAAGVWDQLNKNIQASTYTHPGDPLKIDCGYQPNGVVRLFHGVSLASEPDSAKVLAFTYPALREGIARLEGAKADLTAIVEDEIDRNDKTIQFAIEAMERTSIHVATVSQLSDIAERARAELRM